MSELYFKDQRMTMARWPNNPTEAFTANANSNGRTISYTDDRVDGWAEPTKAWAKGYFMMDWYEQLNKVESIDTTNNTVTFETTNLGYGYGNNMPYFFFNVLEELDSPGEYYIDKDSKQLYFWPPSNLDVAPILSRSALDGTGKEMALDIIKTNQTKHVYFMNLDLGYSRGRAAVSSNSDDIRFVDCTFKHIGAGAVLFNASQNSIVSSSKFFDIGIAGTTVWDSGTNFNTLTSSGNKIINNDMTEVGRLVSTTSSPVSLISVGVLVSHNKIYNSLSLAIEFNGNDNIVEHNEILSSYLHANDGGAVGTGRQVIKRGTVLRYNLIDGVPGYKNKGATGVFLDDATQGITVENNIIKNAVTGINVGGGRDNIINNNIILNYSQTGTTVWPKYGVNLDNRGIGWMAYRYPMKIIAASNTTPIVIKTEHWSMKDVDPTGKKYVITGVEGNTNANGTWDVTKITNDTFSLNSSVGNTDYTTGGEANVTGYTTFIDDVMSKNYAGSPYINKYPELFNLFKDPSSKEGRYQLALPASTVKNNIIWDQTLPNNWLRLDMNSIGPNETLKTHPATIENNFHGSDPKLNVDYSLAADSPARGTGFVPFTPDYGLYSADRMLSVRYPITDPKPGENGSYQLQSSGNKELGGTESFEVFNLPTGATYDSVSKQINWVPSLDQAGKSFSVSVANSYSEPIYSSQVITLLAGISDTASSGSIGSSGASNNSTSLNNTGSGSTTKKSTGSTSTTTNPDSTATTITPTDMNFDNQDKKDTGVVKTLGANKSIAIGATVLFALIVVGVTVFLLRRKTDLNTE